MSALDDILGALPADAISEQVGASPDEVRAAAASVLPALLGGLQANAGDPSGAGSILEALGQHQDDLLSGGADLSAINDERRRGHREPHLRRPRGGRRQHAR